MKSYFVVIMTLDEVDQQQLLKVVVVLMDIRNNVVHHLVLMLEFEVQQSEYNLFVLIVNLIKQEFLYLLFYIKQTIIFSLYSHAIITKLMMGIGKCKLTVVQITKSNDGQKGQKKKEKPGKIYVYTRARKAVDMLTCFSFRKIL